jgi:hypothetical protein
MSNLGAGTKVTVMSTLMAQAERNRTLANELRVMTERVRDCLIGTRQPKVKASEGRADRSATNGTLHDLNDMIIETYATINEARENTQEIIDSII